MAGRNEGIWSAVCFDGRVYQAYSWVDPGINLKSRVKDDSNIFVLGPEETAQWLRMLAVQA